MQRIFHLDGVETLLTLDATFTYNSIVRAIIVQP